MSPLTFSFKRLYLRSMHWQREWAREFEITPARFDMMVAIQQDLGGTAQVEVRRNLGVSSPVVSRMLKSLERCGFVVRTPHPTDGRQRWVRLTALGEQLVRAVRGEILESFVSEGFARSVVAQASTPRRKAKQALTAAHRLIDHWRTNLFDGACVVYPSYRPSGEWVPPAEYAPYGLS